jgi:hypothetical protein
MRHFQGCSTSCCVVSRDMLSFRFDIFTFFHDTGPVASDQHQWPYFQHVLVTGPVPDVADVLRSDASESQRHENTVQLSRKRFKRLGDQSPALPQDRWQYSHTDVLRSDTCESQRHETSQHRQPSACSGAVTRARSFVLSCFFAHEQRAF